MEQRAATHAEIMNPEGSSCSDLLSGSTFRLLVTGGITLNLLIVTENSKMQCVHVSVCMCVCVCAHLGSLWGLCFTLQSIHEPPVSEGQQQIYCYMCSGIGVLSTRRLYALHTPADICVMYGFRQAY